MIKSHNETEVWIEERKSLNDMLRPAGCNIAGSGNGRRKHSVAESPGKMRLSPQRDYGKGRASLYAGLPDRCGRRNKMNDLAMTAEELRKNGKG